MFPNISTTDDGISTYQNIKILIDLTVWKCSEFLTLILKAFYLNNKSFIADIFLF